MIFPEKRFVMTLSGRSKIALGMSVGYKAVSIGPLRQGAFIKNIFFLRIAESP